MHTKAYPGVPQQQNSLLVCFILKAAAQVIPPAPPRAQILTNVVNNAVKFTPAGHHDSVLVTVQRHELASLKIEVVDRGPGLRGQSQRALASEFSSSGDLRSVVTSANAAGIRASGLGIPICIKLAELMGGSATLADRRDGAGARFTLILPLRYVPPAAAAIAASAMGSGAGGAAAAANLPLVLEEATPGPAVLAATRGTAHGSTPAAGAPGAAAAPAAPASAALRDVRGARVLAVDDSPANLRFAVYMLRRMGCVVATCADGDEVVGAVAAAAAAGAPYDVCVMDMYMDRMNGDASLAALRAAHYTLPVVLSTANATRSDAVRYRALGFAGQLAKPFSPEQMHEAIARAIAPQ